LKEKKSQVKFDKSVWKDLPQTLNKKLVILAFPKKYDSLSKKETGGFGHPTEILQCLWGI